MSQAKPGDTVKVHYTGKLEDGSIFDSSTNREPLEFTIGQNRLISGFESGVIGMSPGQSKTIEVPSDQAYGPYREDEVIKVDRSQFPEDMEPEVGQRLNVSRADGGTVVVTVKDTDQASVTLDANHPLAGKDLTFEVELMEIA